MRAFLAGTLLLLFASAAFGQEEITGGVEAIGFGQNYRPECWTPMLVNLTSTKAEAADYEIQVEQEDLDGDTVVFTRSITLNPKIQQKFWVYFLPSTQGLKSRNLDELKRELRVNLYTSGGKLVYNIPLTPGALMNSLEARVSDAGPGKKLVLVVSGDAGLPRLQEYFGARGLIEEPVFVSLRPGDLPENPLGYDSVDAIIWLNVNATELAGGKKVPAIEQWVARGGNLIICQPAQTNNWLDPFADLLPIHLKTESGDVAVKIINCAKAEPLHRIAKASRRLDDSLDHWDDIPKSVILRMAKASAKPGAIVEEWIDWDETNPPETPAADAPDPKSKTSTKPATRPVDRSPFIARLPHGLGAVTWVAQDLASPTLTQRDKKSELQGWAYIWDVIFGWKNETRTRSYIEAAGFQGEKDAKIFEPANAVNIGKSARGDAQFDSKAGAYVALAILFFIGYWVVAGPGGYVFLASKGRKHFSWPTFAGCAILATALTVGVVKLVLRGDPEVKHFSVVRMAEGRPALINSRVDLYIPRDGPQEIKLTGVSDKEVSTIHGLADPPDSSQTREGFTDTGKYEIPVHDTSAEGETSIRVPFRSTLKRLQAQWVGDVPFPIAIQGPRPAVVPPSELRVAGKTPQRRGTITGKLVNNTAGPLRNIFFVFRHQRGQDYMLYVPSWDKGNVMDLELAYNESKKLLNIRDDPPAFNRSVSGTLSLLQWGGYWHSGLKPNGIGGIASTDDLKKGARIYLAMMSVFERVSPARNEIIEGNIVSARADILRRGGRDLDLSGALTAGDLLILAEYGSEANPVPVPFPMEVEKEKITGTGTVYYQFTLPLDRAALVADDEKSSNEKAPAD